MNCEVCGSRDARRRAKIEGAILTVCDDCARTGEEVARVTITRRPKPVFKAPRGIDYQLKKDFSSIIKKNREKRELTQEQLAAKLKEKHTIIRRIEEGWEPPLPVIKKLERFFRIHLMASSTDSDYKLKTKKKTLTLGDIAEIN